MNYEKKYKDALERAEAVIKIAQNQKEVHDCITTIFPELKESEDEKIRKWIIDDIRLNMINEPLDNSEYKKKAEKAIAWLEKQGEQKPVDKVKPKFEVDNWIVYNRNDHSREILQIYDIRDGRYYFTDNVHLSWSIKECDEKSHLWTIRDAKKGDVLAASDDSVFIFTGIIDTGCLFNVACRADGHLVFQNQKNDCWESIASVKPATIEQCDHLFEKIKERGYEWDDKKKELKKIEQKKDINNKLTNFEYSLKHIMKEAIECGDTHNLKADADMLIRLAQKPTSWSEEGKKKLDRIYYLIAEAANEHAFSTTCRLIGDKECVELQDFLKSLKQRMRG